MGRHLHAVAFGVSFVLMNAAAVAQQQPAGQSTAPPASASDAGDESLAEVMVTGSRIVRSGDSSPTPVTVVNTRDLLVANPGTALAEALNTLPPFSGSRGQGSNPTTVGAASGGNAAANQLNLRNLGAIRTLVLMDGKRIPPTTFNGVTDVDMIPQMLVERVDIVTGGVSAVYGSDAVSGVVNHLMDNDFEGLRTEASYGVSEQSDGARTDVGLAFGARFAERFHFVGSYQFRNDEGIDPRSSRSYLQQVGVTGTGTAANPYVLQTNLRQAQFPFGGLITNGALSGQTFRSDGVLSPFVAGTPTGSNGIQIGGDGGYWDSSLIATLKSHQVFGRVNVDVTESVKGYVMVSGNLKTNTGDAESSQLSNVTMSRLNGFLPANYRALIPTTQPTFTFSQLMTQIPRANLDADSDQWVYGAGLGGKVGRYAWSTDYRRGSSNLVSTLGWVLNRQRLAAALDAVSSGGRVVCNASLTNAAYSNCLPYNAFGPTAASPEAIDYVTDDVVFDATTTTDDVTAEISGELFEGWAGPVSGALSAEWRRMEFESVSSSRPEQRADCTSLRFNCTATTPLNDYQFGDNPDGISQSVWEVAGEFELPLVRGAAYADSVSLNGAVRYTNYDTSGSYTTWKIGGDWHVTDALRFRATRSRDIRAPTLYELYAPSNQVPVRVVDLLTGLNVTVPQVTLAKPDLTAEIANTITAGVVWEPLAAFSVALDGYRIKITDAISQVTGSTANLQNACYASGGSSPYCTLQDRPNGFTDRSPSNVVRGWRIQNINLSEIETWGFDLEANYAGELFERPLQVRLLTAWQPHIYYRQPDVPTVDQGGVAFGPLGLSASPEWRVTMDVRLQPAETVAVALQLRWRDAMKLGGDPTQVWVRNRMGSFTTTGINVAWEPRSQRGEFQYFLNIQNLFDAEPPLGAFSGNGPRAGLRDGFALGDDVRGRYFTAGVRVLL